MFDVENLSIVWVEADASIDGCVAEYDSFMRTLFEDDAVLILKAFRKDDTVLILDALGKDDTEPTLDASITDKELAVLPIWT